MATSPNVENLSIFTAVVKWMEYGESSYRDLGEVESCTTAMDFTELPYNSHRHGALVEVKSATTAKTMTVTLVMNEPSDLNLEMVMAGIMAGSPPVIVIGNQKSRGALRVIGKNDVGIKVQMDLYDVEWSPSGDTDWLAGDEWSGFTLEGRVRWVDSINGFGELRPGTSGTELLVNGSPGV